MYSCQATDETKWFLWARDLPDGQWRPLGTECYAKSPPGAEQNVGRQVTEEMVLREVRRVTLPSAAVRIQPERKTLVNFETIFYTKPPTFTRTVRLLGNDVDIEAKPSRYLWHHGDGTTQETATAGAPYPAKDVTHTYDDAHVTVRPRVDVSYQVRWRVDGSAWRSIDQTLTAPGPRTALQIKEGTPQLTDPYRD